MSQKKVDYSKGIIYKLCCKNPNIENIYIGSTTNFKNRKNQHKSDCHNNNNQITYNLYKYEFIRDNGGFENWDMIMIEEFGCNSKKELELRERYWIEELKSDLNSMKRPSTTIEEKKEYMKKYLKNYCEENKNKIKEQKKNKDKTKYYESYKNKMKNDVEYKEKRLEQKRNEYHRNKKIIK